ncbi:MAG: aminotransferase class III-fold pyridoxal phosphate-dependent enzyme [Mesorhizobium sp.]|uniref:aminotransferase n=1 Tax=Mesorhizobium sp. TaxID=1871066 RepID=UPI000FEAA706|nr:aminotransferase [Mesorhizobium sp.]RWD45515.1 MAG: aminotransferase class III-fold pyridoxal phosphate-dependent enzyme [Mesorhizobium sp.]RWE51968.1 MAG: aminotransferase class III-fold pyridoxal phosphate-dependent enzyme [Mesorhizobium sp.]RWF07085.1 MAG: aminotransferase class III-fold pyridoxal phosphate-dependent enzyme [Mesorhizobium sp.]RWF19383.1 MAG: aminotransferase class III-fold pyridoxal phosphate-dependent enzyme [Mesorhizobium sp.]TIY03869.1 MAG: aminotransferase class III-
MTRLNLGTEQIQEKDRSYVFHPSTHLAKHTRAETPNRIMAGAEGVYIWDTEGRKSLDGFGGLYCVNMGYGCSEIADAISKQAHELPFAHVYASQGTKTVALLAEAVVEYFGENMRRVYFGLSGSDANETNIKLVWYYNNILGRPTKKKIISRQRGYHGSGLLTGSLTGLEFFHNHFDLPFDVVRHTTTPHWYRQAKQEETEEAFSKRCAEELEALIIAEGPETVGAFIGEPVLGTGGIIPPPKGYWAAIQAVLDKYDLLLIADEVVCGFARTGEKFGSHLYGMRPDLVTIAKGLSSAYLPISGSIIGERVWKVLEQGTEKFGPLGHGWTYSGHTLCAAAALANIQVLKERNILEHVREVGPYWLEQMKTRLEGHPIVGEVRGVGILSAVEFMRDPIKRVPFDPALQVGVRAAAALLENDVIARAMPHADTLGYAPPLIIKKDEIDIIVEATARAVDTTYRALQSEGTV